MGSKEHGISFKVKLVGEILIDGKTETRRIPAEHDGQIIDSATGRIDALTLAGKVVRSRYGEIGGVLYVRENWRIRMLRYETAIEYQDGVTRLPPPPKQHDLIKIAEKHGGCFIDFPGHDKTRHIEQWRPSIHMFRWMSRADLTLIDRWYEPVTAITEAGALAEGVKSTAKLTPAGDDYTGSYASENFARLWDEINGARGPGGDPGRFLFDRDPIVEVLRFKRISHAGKI